MIRKIKETYKRFMRPKHYENFIEASYSMGFLRKIFGVSVYTLKSAPDGRISAQFTYLGFITFIFWYSLYFFCVYRIYRSDQTILRSLYNTKLQHYGDEVERISTTIYVIYTMWKLPFDVRLDVRYMQLLVDIDKAIENLGESLHFSKYARSIYVTAIFSIFMTAIRGLITWLSLGNLRVPIQLEKVFQVVYSDALALVTTSRYCGYLHLLTSRYKILNKVLATVDAPKSQNTSTLLTVRRKNAGRTLNMLKFLDEYSDERLRSCGKIYGMLYDATETANKKFGFSIALTMLTSFILIVLYLFYFMEATASGLFHNIQRYVDFLIYVLWQILFAIGVVYLNIYFSENTVREAKYTSFVTHKIINSEVDSSVRTEAVHLSLQIMHQLPVFTANGLCRIDYMLFLEGGRTLVTFLVILLQFAAD